MTPRFFRGMVLLLSTFAASEAGAQAVFRVVLDKPIHPVTQEFVVRAIGEANERGAALILLQIDTPGGYVSSVEAIQRAVLESKAPVAAYVAPPGARATSGGAFVALACDLIAMAPGTTIGSAHPVSAVPIPLPSTPPPSKPGSDQPEEGGERKPPPQESETGMQKMVNDLSAHMRSYAENRGRNPAKAEAMVRESLSFTEKEALASQVIELVANEESNIFAYLAANPVRRFKGEEERLNLGASPPIYPIQMTFREKALSALADPSLAYILFLLGVLGLFVEFKAPGLIFPGVLGGIFLLLYLMSIPLLPVNVVGLLLVLLGIVFFILEVKVVSYGMLTAGGVISLVAGGLMMYQEGPVPELRLALGAVLPIALAFAAVVVFLLVLAARAFKYPVATGKEAMVGQRGVVRQAITPPSRGKVFVFGELWDAEADQPIEPEAVVRVSAVEGMVLKVKVDKLIS